MMSEILTPTYCNDDHDRNCECPYKSSVGRHPAAETNRQIVKTDSAQRSSNKCKKYLPKNYS